jgi:energy-coupling factor transporter ATP-binding protein EcfA2
LWIGENDDQPYMTVASRAGAETYRIGSPEFEDALSWEYFDRFQGVASEAALREAAKALRMFAKKSGKRAQAFVRIGQANGFDYLDLGTSDRKCIEIRPGSWQVLASSPVAFLRPQGFLPLPQPVSDFPVDGLQQFWNVRRDIDFRLLLVWVSYSIQRKPTYPPLALFGPKGSGKSTLTECIQKLIDPTTASRNSLPGNEQDLAVALQNLWVFTVDNCQELPRAMSSSLCRVATRGTFSTRQLFTNTGEVRLALSRPFILNNLENVIRKDDLAERTLVINLQKPKPRLTEAQYWANFDAHRAGLLGSILTVVAKGLVELPQVNHEAAFRMADFEAWGIAVERALEWPTGQFRTDYGISQREAVRQSARNVLLAESVEAIAGSGWHGTATDLLRKLNGMPQVDSTDPTWPKDAVGLSKQLRAMTTTFADLGLAVSFSSTGRGNSRQRTIDIRMARSTQTPVAA